MGGRNSNLLHWSYFSSPDLTSLPFFLYSQARDTAASSGAAPPPLPSLQSSSLLFLLPSGRQALQSPFLMASKDSGQGVLWSKGLYCQPLVFLVRNTRCVRTTLGMLEHFQSYCNCGLWSCGFCPEPAAITWLNKPSLRVINLSRWF